MAENHDAIRALRQNINERERALEAAVKWCRQERKDIKQLEASLAVLESGQNDMFGKTDEQRRAEAGTDTAGL